MSVNGVVDAFELVPGATRNGFSGIGLSLRLMADQRGEALSAQAHLLIDLVSLSPGAPPPAPSADSPFRAWDLGAFSRQGERAAARSELDRLWLTWEGSGVRVTGGRFGLTWGEGWFFNPLDLFGAFPLDAVNRAWKPGIDGGVATLGLGEFGEAAVAAVPRTDRRAGSAAVRVIFPAGRVSLSLVAGEVARDRVGGAGASADLAGSKVYAQALFTDPPQETGEDGFWQGVAGWERQTGAQTHLLLELYRNGWGARGAAEYPARLGSPRLLSGRVPAIGRYQLAAEGSAQLTPLLTGGIGGVSNLDDGSTLGHLSLDYSLSDYADLKGTVFAGLGRRPREGIPRSEWGLAPARIAVELSASF